MREHMASNFNQKPITKFFHGITAFTTILTPLYHALLVPLVRIGAHGQLDPHASPIRRDALLYNIFDNR